MKKMYKTVLKKAAIYLTIGLVIGQIVSANLHREEDIMQRAVKIISPHGQCSGVQIRANSGRDYILSAGHCRVLEDKDHNYTIITENGERLQRKFIAEDPFSDLLLIEGLPNMKGLDIANDVNRRQHIRTFTHGTGLDTFKTEGELVQYSLVQIPMDRITSDKDKEACESMPKNRVEEIDLWLFKLEYCVMTVPAAIVTARVYPGSSGGMAVNDSGELVGIVSAVNTETDMGLLVIIENIIYFMNAY